VNGELPGKYQKVNAGNEMNPQRKTRQEHRPYLRLIGKGGKTQQAAGKDAKESSKHNSVNINKCFAEAKTPRQKIRRATGDARGKGSLLRE